MPCKLDYHTGQQQWKAAGISLSLYLNRPFQARGYVASCNDISCFGQSTQAGNFQKKIK